MRPYRDVHTSFVGLLEVTQDTHTGETEDS